MADATPDKKPYRAILARKEGMTQLFDEKGQVVPVTVLKAGPCVVTCLLYTSPSPRDS